MNMSFLGNMWRADRSDVAGGQMNEESSWQRHDASTDRVTQETPLTETYTLHQRTIEMQRCEGHHEEEQDPVHISRLGLCDHDKGSRSGGESIWRGIVHTVNKHVTRIYAAPITIPRTQIEDTMNRCSRKYLDRVPVVYRKSHRQVF